MKSQVDKEGPSVCHSPPPACLPPNEGCDPRGFDPSAAESDLETRERRKVRGMTKMDSKGKKSREDNRRLKCERA
ncbi:hypothetical protein Nepgr_012640 [Nepenthes gracilis]|uniref:Uncharacterized protein n=1 Tax=Nepenthes gracilis TaxID=150966 RepID=A0AAD3XNC2_NEPGR|nr:hypothetical protein Nepgr_012640 [Nepenthes gracilis]